MEKAKKEQIMKNDEKKRERKDEEWNEKNAIR